MIYLDHNAATPCREEVLAAMAPFWREQFANPLSSHGPGQAAYHAVECARDQLRQAVGAGRDWAVVFTGSGTEADNLAVRGALAAGGAALVSPIEHKAVLEAIPEGTPTAFFAVGASGVAAIGDEPPPDDLRLVSLMLANNETGAIQPVRAAAERAREAGALMHTDAIQALGRIAIDVEELGVDLVSLSAHKIGGPKGVGALLLRSGVELPALVRGGAQEDNLRAGTHNVPGIVGFGLAAKLAASAAPDEALRRRLEEGVLVGVPTAELLAAEAPRLPNTAMIAFPGCQTQTLLAALDQAGVAAGAGAACSAGGAEPSHVVAAMGLRPEAAVRFSLGRETTAAEIDAAIEIVVGVVERQAAARASADRIHEA